MLRRISRLAADRPVTRPARVEFGMYPFASVAWAWDELWYAVRSRVGWAPDEITPTGDVHAGWGDERCVVTQICGGPLVAEHRHDWEVIGAFSLDVPHAADPAHYRSVLLSRHDRPVVELTAPTTRAVANSADSLSGWFSLLAATVGPGGTWPGDVVFAGSHLAGIRALAAGDADLASVDGWSLALIADHLPELVGDLHAIGLGPVVPTPPVAARPTLGESRVTELRDAFVDAVSDPAVAGALAALRIAEFVRLDLDDYLPILSLRPSG